MAPGATILSENAALVVVVVGAGLGLLTPAAPEPVDEEVEAETAGGPAAEGGA